MSRLTRRNFLRTSLALGAAASWTAAHRVRAAGDRIASPDVDLAVVTGDDPARNGLAAVDALGGFGRFIRPGARVCIKPNPIGTSPPEAALNTHPDLLAAVIRGCREAGAARVAVVSHDSMRWMQLNGTARAVTDAGGELIALEREDQFREIPIPRGRLLRRERVATEVLDADVFINMPIAKHHAETEITLSLKNLMGVNFDRVRFHRIGIHECIAELGAAVAPHLVIMDANHVLMTNGPAGPGDVRHARQVIAGVDPLAVDAFTCRAFFGEPDRIGHLRMAHSLGAGEMDLARLAVREIAL